MLRDHLDLPVEMLPQPDETTCGPTCLHAIYRYWGREERLRDVIERTSKLQRGGTVAVFLACDALRQGFEATIYTYNLQVFDPTWFAPGADLSDRLLSQRMEKVDDPRVQEVTAGYLDFLSLGGRLRLKDLSRYLLRGLMRRGVPILTGLSSTYLYRTRREYGPQDLPDDIRGTPGGHFVVLSGYDRPRRTVRVSDPYGPHPYGPSRDYWLGIDRAVGAILLGIVTHDANLLVIRPPGGKRT
ncbi:hypothetical protein SAMN05421829_110135 [Aromatoleum tolulyticum]|uniref:Peptidase_C39 like family protein n=1 Tax=Aromatoleum tolulyticum TaxID=34027 RepID=A0A1N6YLQ8_9RHOO|nr:hypothetical protein [Aromatoleum tolulyticum]SIR15543.1 hypothetical protein SAMN05421829_110135 [Aromatoleum tolulyticum]